MRIDDMTLRDGKKGLTGGGERSVGLGTNRCVGPAAMIPGLNAS